MTGNLFINSKDAWLTWGVALVKGGYESILTPPNNKPYTTNEQRGASGTQVFYDNPQPMERDFNVSFFIDANTKEDYLIKFNNFVNEIRNGQVIIRIPSLKMEIKVHVVNFLNLSYYGSKGIFNVRFNEPNIKQRVYL